MVLLHGDQNLGTGRRGRIKPINPLIAVIIINWNTRELLLHCLESVRLEAEQVPLETIVVDNASADASAEAVAARFPEVHLLRNASNLGFAAAVNQGLALAKAPYWALINADVELLPGALSGLLKTLEDHPEIWAVGPQLLNLDGSVQPSGRRFPTLFRMAMEGLLPGAWQRTPCWKRQVFGRTDFSRVLQVSEVSGACFLARRKAFEWVGKFDERFFLYFEELDWFVRLAAAGGRVLYQPGSRAIHHWGASTKQVQPLSRLWHYQSCFFYWRKRGGLSAEIAARAISLLHILAGLAAKTLLTLVFVKRWQDYAYTAGFDLLALAETVYFRR